MYKKEKIERKNIERERDCILAQATVLITIEGEDSYKNKVVHSSHTDT